MEWWGLEKKHIERYFCTNKIPKKVLDSKLKKKNLKITKESFPGFSKAKTKL